MNQLYDQSNQVAQAALHVLEEACDIQVRVTVLCCNIPHRPQFYLFLSYTGIYM